MKTLIKCPNCGHDFNVEEALSGKLESHFKTMYEKKVAKQIEKFNIEKQKLQEERNKFVSEKEKQNEFLKKEIEKKLQIEKGKIEKAASDSFNEKIKFLEEENKKKQAENIKLKQKEISLLKMESKLLEEKDELTLQLEKQLLEKKQELEKNTKLKLTEQEEKFALEREKITREMKAIFLSEKKDLEKALNESYESKLTLLEEENNRRKKENNKLKQIEIDLLKKEKELLEKEEDITFQIEKQFLEKQKEIEEKARQKERENFNLEKVKLLKQIDDNKKLAEEMKRKAEQGSMQLQGEVQELAIEDLLSQTYPFDTIQEVPKGVRGADVIQIVNNAAQKKCGSIVYESKRTKHFANDWVDKLKQDMLICKGDVAVLVTETFPKDMERFGEKNGIWICGFHEVKSLSYVLREMLIKSHSVKTSEENKGDKMELLYHYLTSNEFVQNIKRIVENYDNMINQLNTEKKAMHRIWKTREKQIWVVQENLAALFGSIKGIAGKELESVDVLQLPDVSIEE